LLSPPSKRFRQVGAGQDLTILSLAQMIAAVTGFTGRILTDREKPDGTMRKCLDVSALARLGWHARTQLQDGIAQTYAWYEEHLRAGHALRAS
ncbi:MAG: GDP-L-fucose synthase, partial [Pseudomonadota bacterium]